MNFNPMVTGSWSSLFLSNITQKKVRVNYLDFVAVRLFKMTSFFGTGVHCQFISHISMRLLFMCH